jgi:DnaK suppressor protein
MVAKKKVRKKAVAKKKPARKTVAKKKVKARVVRKKPTKKRPVRKAAAAKPAQKKQPVRKAVVVAKPLLKKRPGKEPKAARDKSSGKAKIFALRSKVFRRSATEVQPFKPYRAERGEEYMNAAQMEHFRKILLDWKKLLMEEVDRTVHHMQDEAANFPDPNDRATQEEEFALELRTRDRERKLIRKIEEAIVSLETGDYGYCEVCGVEIGIKRLEARPTATLCIDCKTLDEIKEKQLG